MQTFQDVLNQTATDTAADSTAKAKVAADNLLLQTDTQAEVVAAQTVQTDTTNFQQGLAAYGSPIAEPSSDNSSVTIYAPPGVVVPVGTPIPMAASVPFPAPVPPAPATTSS